MSVTSPLQYAVGSEAWTDGLRYSGRWKNRLKYVLGQIDEEALISRALFLRGLPNLECSVSKKYSAGDYNVVRRLSFSDGVSWIARIRMPALDAADWEKLLETERDGDHSVKSKAERNIPFTLTEHERYAIESEVSTMRLISARTSITVPTVHDYMTTYDNPIGFPYIFMDYIDGSTAFELSTLYGDPMRVPSQYQSYFFSQLAGIMVELASLRFPAIGSITSREGSTDVSDMVIGPCADTFTGPYKTSEDFYAEYPTAIAETLNIRNGASKQLVGLGIAAELKKIMLEGRAKSTPDNEDPFVLVNLEMGTHNVLVDSLYTIVGIIDWDSTFSFPVEAAHMFPSCTGAEPGVPGATEEVSFICPPLNDERRAVCEAFASAVHHAAQARAATASDAGSALKPDLTLTKAGFFTKEALAFRPLMFLKAKQDWVDEAWVPGLQHLQRRQS